MNYNPAIRRDFQPSSSTPYVLSKLAWQSISAGRYTPVKPDYVADFHSYYTKWKSETYYTSSITDLTEHASFKKIVAMGERAIPLIIERIKREPSFLILALSEITSERPFSDDAMGDIQAMTSSWIEWAERSGY